MAVKRRAVEAPAATPVVSDEAAPADFIWTAERELELFEALLFHKPAGLAKHFQMALVVSRLQQSSAVDMKGVSAGAVWRHLDTLYNMTAANQVERPAELSHRAEAEEFSLPVRDFHSAIADMKLTDKLPESARMPQAAAAAASASTTPASNSKRPTRSTPASSKRRK